MRKFRRKGRLVTRLTDEQYNLAMVLNYYEYSVLPKATQMTPLNIILFKLKPNRLAFLRNS